MDGIGKPRTDRGVGISCEGLVEMGCPCSNSRRFTLAHRTYSQGHCRAGANMNIGLIGCGSASRLYLDGSKQFDAVRFTACADLVRERAHEKADAFNIPKVCDVEELLDDP